MSSALVVMTLLFTISLILGHGDVAEIHSRLEQFSACASISLAIPLWVGAVSTSNGCGHRWGRKQRVLSV